MHGLTGMHGAALEQVIALEDHLAHLYPAYRIVEREPLGPDAGATRGSTTKAAGYGRPLRIVLEDANGKQLELVWRVGTANEFGHDRRADRAANALLAFEDFVHIPQHIVALDVGAIGRDGKLVSLRDAGELYLLTNFARGSLYAADLRELARTGVASERDLARAKALGSYLARLHVPLSDPARYRRAIRDLVGHGEGIFGMIDGYPPDVPGASPARLHAIELRCVEWRWRLRHHEGRLARTHGDFHPFNIVFTDDTQFTLLDASRGTCGDPADDVVALAINYLLFAIDAPSAWAGGLGKLWHALWRTYAAERPDASLLACVPPYLAWRALVVCNPVFYPELSAEGRAALLGLVEASLEAKHFDPKWADELFT
jgi:hypothetical protein